METLKPNKDEFVRIHGKDLEAVLSQKDNINTLLATAVKLTHATGAAEVCLRIEFQAGYEGHNTQYLKNVVNLMRNYNNGLAFGGAIGMAAGEGSDFKEVTYDQSLYVLGQSLRSTILETISKESTLRQNPSDFSWFTRIALYGIVLE